MREKKKKKKKIETQTRVSAVSAQSKQALTQVASRTLTSIPRSKPSDNELHKAFVKLDEINLNAGDARTNVSAVEDKSKIDTSVVKGMTMIPKAEHEVMDMSYLMERIEAIPYHDLFIHSYEGFLPRGLER